jgi:uncharacterized protein (TIGR02145 family)
VIFYHLDGLGAFYPLESTQRKKVKTNFYKMKLLNFAFLMLLLCQSAFSQSKKEQIETLIFQKDSLSSVLEKERQLNSNQVKQLEAKIFKINSDMGLIQKELDQSKKELTQSKKELAAKEEEILGHQLDHVLREDTIRSLREELHRLKSLKITNSNEVVIGSQVWMNKNLDAVRFRNGDLIPEAKTDEQWLLAFKNKQPAWCYYNNDPSNGEKYGKLYNWYAVNDPRGLAPEGWHIPTDAEWTKLSTYLGDEEDQVGVKMKSISGWNDNGNGTNASGFSGHPGGARQEGGLFFDVGYLVGYWSSTEKDYELFENSEDDVTDFDPKGYAWFRALNYYDGGVYRNRNSKGRGYSVRCLMD